MLDIFNTILLQYQFLPIIKLMMAIFIRFYDLEKTPNKLIEMCLDSRYFIAKH